MDGPELTPAEAEHLARAAQIAEAGWGRVAPNPRVGCVLVRNGAVLAEGAHTEYGGPHAEIVALRRAGDATGTTAFVSLEPCNHHGKTPPCVDALLEAGVSRVVFGAALIEKPIDILDRRLNIVAVDDKPVMIEIGRRLRLRTRAR